MEGFRKICDEGVQSYAPEEREDYRADFSLNENPLGCSEKVLKALEDLKKEEIADYQPLRKPLVERIAEYEDVSEENIIVSAGSDKCLQTIASCIFKPEKKVAYPSPSFPRYSFYARFMDSEPLEIRYPLFNGRSAEGIVKEAEDADYLIIDSPSNPSGYCFSDEELEFIADSFEGHLIIDGALDNGSIDAERFLRDDVFLVKSFSKYFGMSGLRIGYIVTEERNASLIDSVISPFEVGIAAQKAAEVALEDKDHLKKSSDYIEKERIRLKKGLEQLGIRYTDSESTNMVAELDTQIQEQLEEAGINFTKGEDYRGLPDNTVRLGVRTEEENKILLSELEDIK